MSGFQFILTPAGRAAMINAENTGTNAVLIHRIGLSDSAAGIVGGALAGERKRVASRYCSSHDRLSNSDLKDRF